MMSNEGRYFCACLADEAEAYNTTKKSKRTTFYLDCGEIPECPKKTRTCMTTFVMANGTELTYPLTYYQVDELKTIMSEYGESFMAVCLDIEYINLRHVMRVIIK